MQSLGWIILSTWLPRFQHEPGQVFKTTGSLDMNKSSGIGSPGCTFLQASKLVSANLVLLSVLSGTAPMVITDSCSSLTKLKWLLLWMLGWVEFIGAALALPAAVVSIGFCGFNLSEVWLALVINGSSSRLRESISVAVSKLSFVSSWQSVHLHMPKHRAHRNTSLVLR